MDRVQELALVPAANTRTDTSTLNILLLGPTGVGKSTFINALCNYLSYPSLDEALEGDVKSLIYSGFTLSSFENRKIVKKTVSVGKRDEDEGAASQGASCTQKCKAYNFNIQGTQSIRLIDTPGIGDTRGYDQDVKNMKDILSFISQYEVLHAVCILLRPDEERLTKSLRYCVVHLLEKLHKDASSNILFCFTNSRKTFYQPGNTVVLVEDMLKPKSHDDFIELNIKLDDQNTLYFFDSESFRFLAAKKNDIKFPDKETDNFKSSWTQSSEEAVRLIGHIASLEPHYIQDTLALNRVRVMLETIQKPLCKISANIQANLEETRKIRNEVSETCENIKNYAKQLVRAEVYEETYPLDHPRTICTEPKCKDKVCHDRCSNMETAFGLLDSVGKLPLARDIVSELIDSALPVPILSIISKHLPPATIPVLSNLGVEDANGDAIFCNKLSFRSGKCRTCDCPNTMHIRESSV